MSTVYKCKSCGAPLRFDPHTGKLKCDHCDSYFFPYEYHHTRLERRHVFKGEAQDSLQNIISGADKSRPDQPAVMPESMQDQRTEIDKSRPDQPAVMPESMQDQRTEIDKSGPDQSAVMPESMQGQCTQAVMPESMQGQCTQTVMPNPDQPENISNSNQPDREADQSGGIAVYHCPNCGAEVLAADTAIADRCVYCGYPVAFAGTLEDEFRPDFLLPFEKDISDAVSGYRGVLKSAPFAPKEFREKSALERFRGVYVPVWLYTMDVQARIDVRGRVDGKKILGYTDYGPITQDGSEMLAVHEEGVIHYENIVRDGLRELDDLIVRCLSPYDYWRRRAFDASYLAGFYAQRWDVDFDACSEEVRREVMDAAFYDIHEHACDLTDDYASGWDTGDDRGWNFTQANASRWDGGVRHDEGKAAARTNTPGQDFRRTTNRLDLDGGFKVLGNDVLPPNRGTGYEGNIIGERVEYALVPVWLMYTKYKNKDYMFAMNGQTGEIDGNMPVSVPRVLMYLGLTALMIVVIVLLNMWSDGGFMIAAVLPVLWFLNLVRKQSDIGLNVKNVEPVHERMYRRLAHEERKA